ASRATSTAGRSDAGSAWATLPPIVPRLRTAGSPTCAAASARAGAARPRRGRGAGRRSEEHTSELQSPYDLVCRLLLEKKQKSTEVERTFVQAGGGARRAASAPDQLRRRDPLPPCRDSSRHRPVVACRQRRHR